MSYGMTAAFQTALYQHLVADAAVSALVGTDIYDAVPSGQVPDLYVSLGIEDGFAHNDVTGLGAWHTFTVSVVSDSAGFLPAKELAAAISDALQDATPVMSRGRVVRIDFRRASARRVGSGDKRQIDMRFAARLEDD